MCQTSDPIFIMSVIQNFNNKSYLNFICRRIIVKLWTWSKEFTCQIWFGLRWRNTRFRNITFSPRHCEREVAGEANKPVEFKQLKYKI